VPIALVCALPEARVHDDLKRFSMRHLFDAVVTAEDSGAPEVEFAYSYASQCLARPAIRCVVVGDSNTSVSTSVSG
jgi:beta-phosphoglucomutase-like phosphatase (HAD superfamily)